MTKQQLENKNPLVIKSQWIWYTALVVFVLDHLTKYLAIKHLKAPGVELHDIMGSKVISIVPNFFNLRYAVNTGGAFSMMENNFWLLTVMATFFLGILVYWVYKIDFPSRWLWLSFGLIIGGAIGNLIDRFLRKGVIDFIDWHWYEKAHWPTFNIADSGICVGMAILIWINIFQPIDGPPEKVTEKESKTNKKKSAQSK